MLLAGARGRGAPPSGHARSRVHLSLQHARTRDNPKRRLLAQRAASSDVAETTAAERFSKELLATLEVQEVSPVAADTLELRQQLAAAQAQVAELDAAIDALYSSAFDGLAPAPADAAADAAADADATAAAATAAPAASLPLRMTEAAFGALGRDQPALMRALLAAKEAQEGGAAWLAFQQEVHRLKLRRQRAQGEARDLADLLTGAEREEAMRPGAAAAAAAAAAPPSSRTTGGGAAGAGGAVAAPPLRVVLVTGFESFNQSLYKRAAQELARVAPHIRVSVFSDRDIATQRDRIAAALAEADVFFGSLLFDFDQVEWLRGLVARVPYRFVFESALELMGTTQVGTFVMDPSGKSKGPPPAVAKVLSLFGSGREEDRMVGYLSMLKVGPALLRLVPGNRARDLRTWLTVYSYWNQGGLDNVVAMFQYLGREVAPPTTPAAAAPPPPPPAETPGTGCVHPSAPGRTFPSPAAYMEWYAREGPLRGTDAPVVGVLLYRKHVITRQPYIGQMISQLEAEGLLPLPIFINGVEAHTIVRDQLTSAHQLGEIAAGRQARGSLRGDAVAVDALVSTIGFPLVGGPAGTMEGGRQADVAKAILGGMAVPYCVAAPLLIQGLDSWARDGVAGLQSVVLYSLPELDGAIDTVVCGGLVGDDIYLIPERVTRLAGRIRKWVALRRKPPAERRVAVVLYGFPPGVGATGTAALLNVPASLEALLRSLQAAGYDLGTSPSGAPWDGEALLGALKRQEDARTLARGAAGVLSAGAGAAEAFGARAACAELSPSQLRALLTFPPEWGPTEWGPIPYLPEPDLLVANLERNWGALETYRGLGASAAGALLVPGVQLGNVWVGVQPALGIEGDPMRLLFERDLTPHPGYVAFYRWLEAQHRADAVVHFGMHGTVEWLPGSPLGNSGLSWSDVLLGSLPNVYLYAANNPSESIVAKRRGYGVIVSHNVPPYGRAGLYKQLASLRELLAEYREAAAGADGAGGPSSPSATALKAPILDALLSSGLQQDCPWPGGGEAPEGGDADALDDQEFAAYAGTLWSYLGELENRLFSEGLHVLGAAPTPGALASYLGAYFDGALPPEAVDAVAAEGGAGLAAVRRRLEAAWVAPSATAATATPPRVPDAQLEAALEVRALLERNTEELGGLLAALDGRYVLPEAGGDLLRDGPGVLPTGRNIHALDPYRMPSPAALQRGAEAAEAILSQHRAAHGGAWPETIAVNLWGLDAIKTKGESVALALHLLGAAPVREGTGRIARFELLPLEALGGRPRVDVLCNMSGIFRDSFQNVVELLDAAFQRAADADEPDELNYVAKHARAMKRQGIANASARLFSNPAGDYGSMVNERVGASNWESGSELGDTWVSRNAFSYGRGGERGVARPEVLNALLTTTDRIVQQVDSVEYGLTDIQEYYANTGALKRAAQTARGEGAPPVGCSIVEAFSKEVKPRELEEVLRMEYRSKLLNPRWAAAMAAQGSGGAFEISQRMTALLGWGATVQYADAWTWDQAADTYALDPDMADKLRSSNPQAYANVLRRCLEAAGRGLWAPKEEVLDRLRRLYADMDDELEGVR